MENNLEKISEYFPMWKELTPIQQKTLMTDAKQRKIKSGQMIYNGALDCLGLVLISTGQLRAFILSDEGREVTIYRLFERDICLFSASCMMNSIQFEISIEAETDAVIWVIPPENYKNVMNQSAPLANYTNQIMASRFSEVMWLVEQIMWKSFDQRLATFLVDEMNLTQSDTIQITHEKIANHLGTAREVVTRMLRYFQNEGIVKISRGSIVITNVVLLQKLIDTK